MQMENNLVVGNNAMFIGCCEAIVIGDECIANIDNQVVVGDTLFGKEIPNAVKQVLKDHPNQIAWLIKTIANRNLTGTSWDVI